MKTRRDALFAMTASSSAALVLSGTPAQSQEALEYRRQFGPAVANAVSSGEGSLNLASGVFGEPDFAAATDAAFTARSSLSNLDGGDQDLDLVRAESLLLSEEIRRNDLSLNPVAEDITPIGAPVEPEDESESLQDVLWDVLLQTMGLDASIRLSIKEGLRQVASRFGLQPLIDDIGEAAARRQWFRCQRLLQVLLGRVFSAEALAALAERLGPAVYRRILARTAAYAIPFVGWAILAAAFVAALINNYDRIERVLPALP